MNGGSGVSIGGVRILRACKIVSDQLFGSSFVLKLFKAPGSQTTSRCPAWGSEVALFGIYLSAGLNIGF